MKKFKEFEEHMEHLLDTYEVPGCIVAIAEHGNIVYEKSFGFKNKEKALPIDRNTVFGLASLTKSFTCAAVMRLVEEEKINLHAPITDYLPNFKIENKEDLEKITVHHFMNHSSGIPPLPSLDYAMHRKRNNDCLVDYLESHVDEITIDTYESLMNYMSDANVQLFAQPGKLFSYSNDAYGLLGAVIERASGIPYEQYVVENIIHPCGMKRTYFTREEYGNDENITTCYELYELVEGNVVYEVQDWWDAPAMRATGFLKSTASDMITYSQLFINKGMVDGKRILTEKSVQQMVYPHVKMDPERFYGYGLTINPNYFGDTLIEHGGSLQSISSKFGMIIEKGVSVIVLANLSGFPASRTMELALNAYFNRDIDAQPFVYEAYSVDDETLASYQGIYRSRELEDVTIEVNNDETELYYKEKKYPIKWIREHVFLAEMDDTLEPIEIIVDENGAPTAMSIFHRIVPKLNK